MQNKLQRRTIPCDIATLYQAMRQQLFIRKKHDTATINKGIEMNKRSVWSLVNSIELRCIGSACPEQYEAYLNEEKVGYIRLRWGTLTVKFPDVNGELIFIHRFEEEWKGMFFEMEAEYWLLKCKVAIVSKMLENK